MKEEETRTFQILLGIIQKRLRAFAAEEPEHFSTQTISSTKTARHENLHSPRTILRRIE